MFSFTYPTSDPASPFWFSRRFSWSSLFSLIMPNDPLKPSCVASRDIKHSHSTTASLPVFIVFLTLLVFPAAA